MRVPTRFDWKDGVLVSAGMIATVAALAALRGLGVELETEDGLVHAAVGLGMGGPVLGRRALFGGPVLPEPRPGALASLASILGLLATLLGMLLGLLGVSTLARTFAPAPDFEAKAIARAREVTAQVDGILAGVVPGSPAQRDAEVVAEAKRAAAEQRAEWEANRDHWRTRGGGLTAAGLVLVVLGALAAWWRYPKPAKPS